MVLNYIFLSIFFIIFRDPVKIIMDKNTKFIIFLLEAFILVNCLRLLIHARLQKFNLGKTIAFLGILFYFIFLLTITLNTFVF